jgi:hypothetical protein
MRWHQVLGRTAPTQRNGLRYRACAAGTQMLPWASKKRAGANNKDALCVEVLDGFYGSVVRKQRDFSVPRGRVTATRARTTPGKNGIYFVKTEHENCYAFSSVRCARVSGYW